MGLFAGNIVRAALGTGLGQEAVETGREGAGANLEEQGDVPPLAARGPWSPDPYLVLLHVCNVMNADAAGYR